MPFRSTPEAKSSTKRPKKGPPSPSPTRPARSASRPFGRGARSRYRTNTAHCEGATREPGEPGVRLRCHLDVRQVLRS
ncbi:DUF6207 family protein [Streptomyces coeruleorubidus]|uniref:DUF6207 family protein n=1 Tax=Streptomyces coeruleorubidus TaxID=116188 RepID=UPI003CD03238